MFPVRWHVGKSSFSHGATVPRRGHGRTSDADLLVAHLSARRRQAGHTQVMLYYADLLKVNLITLVIPDQRVFLPAKNPKSRGGKKKREKNMTTNQKAIS